MLSTLSSCPTSVTYPESARDCQISPHPAATTRPRVCRAAQLPHPEKSSQRHTATNLASSHPPTPHGLASEFLITSTAIGLEHQTSSIRLTYLNRRPCSKSRVPIFRNAPAMTDASADQALLIASSEVVGDPPGSANSPLRLDTPANHLPATPHSSSSATSPDSPTADLPPPTTPPPGDPVDETVAEEPAENTPLRSKVAANHRDPHLARKPLERDSRRTAHAGAMEHYLAGPVSFQSFVQEFFDVVDFDAKVHELETTHPKWREIFRHEFPVVPPGEQLMAEAVRTRKLVCFAVFGCTPRFGFADVTLQATILTDHTMCPGMTFTDTSKSKPHVNGIQVSPDGMLYDAREQVLAAKGIASFADCELFYEDKTKTSSDIFDDTGSPASLGVPAQETRKRFLGQSVDYATAMQEETERTHCFSISCAGECTLALVVP
jgi:hypothetical protein